MDRQQVNSRPPKRKANSQTVNQRQQFQGGGPDVVDQGQPLQDFSSFPPQPYPGMLPFMNFPAMGFLPRFHNVQQPAFMPDPQFGSIPWQAYPLPFPFVPMTDQPLPPLMNEFTPINQLRGGRGRRGEGGEEYHHPPPAAEAAPSAPSRPQPSQLETATSATASASADQGGRGSADRGRDPIVPPSAESGGVPEPTAAYLAQAGRPAQQLQRPQPLLVVLDLNGTLLHRPNRKRPTHFVARRHARDFLNYLLDTFWVVIWSSARPGNIAGMTEQLLTSAQRARLVAVWSRDDFGLSPADYGRRVQCYKRLAALWADARVAGSHPRFAAGDGRWGQANTVLVDDSVEKARSEPYNLVRIPEFTGQITERERDDGDEEAPPGRGGVETDTKVKQKQKQKQKKKAKAREEELLRNGAAAPGSGNAASAAVDGGEDDAAGGDCVFQDVLPQVHDYINHLALQEDVSAFIRENPFQVRKGGWGLRDSTPP